MHAIYVLTRDEHDIDWDGCEGFVICATSDEDARGLAAPLAGDEGAGTWRDPEKSTCKRVGTPDILTPVGVLLKVFRSG